MKFKYILLDWDGCLIDTLGVWSKAYFSVYKKYGNNVSMKDIVSKSWGNNETGPKNIGIKNYLKCWEDIVKKVKENMPEALLHKHTDKLLQNSHKNNFKIAIVTSSERRIIEPTLKLHKLGKFIDYLITEGEVLEPKPNPEILFKAMDYLHATKDLSIIVGDSSKDIIAGNNAGIKSALILHDANRPYYDFEKLKTTNPSYIFNNLKELDDFLTD